jgi:F0F1-type ATP synthase epsilon subunit
MKKLILLALVAISMNGIAQNSETASAKKKAGKVMEKDAQELANKLCVCTDGVVKQYHPLLQNLLMDMITIGEAEATKKFGEGLLKVTAEENAKIMTDITLMQNFEKEMAEKCTNALDLEYAKYNDIPEFQEKMLQYMKALPECAFTHQLMLAGEKK